MIGEKIKQLRTENKWTQQELANRLHVGKTTVSNYETGHSDPNIDMINQLSEIFEVSVGYLLEKKGNKIPIKDKDYATINVYGSIPAGIPIEAIEDISDTEDISFKDFDKNKTYIGLKVEGDSMYPKYLEGDTIILELTPYCESGTDAAVYVNGYDVTLKTVIKNENGTITLKPINTSYPPKTYGKDDEPIKILGIVKEIRRKI
ncbi:LexA family protein [Anaerococcus hydrogenalis]|uniref:LexA family protein n=1 Tax=Anaerococcus hydrogenalis TaxID=33029 RepID=UPI001E03CE88|nr:XRE family transcriptional regulator [Anaerococcus hydrogenalis]MBS5988868.1 helix-turn-helix domain-containing protein [Anaerococcus hydrogenalis]